MKDVLQLREIAFGTRESGEEAVPLPACMRTMREIAWSAPSPLICIVTPSKGDVATGLAISMALEAVRRDFPAMLDDYARTEFRERDLVEVVPSGFVYEYGGHFEQRHGLMFRLRVLDRNDGLARSLHAGEVLRLQKTERRNKKGRERSTLGEATPVALDRLLGIRTLGNTAILRTSVLLHSNRNTFEDNVAVSTVRARAADGLVYGEELSLADVLPWGGIREDGQPYIQDGRTGQPAVAVSSSLDCIHRAATRLRENSVCVIVDGAHRLLNFQPLLEIAERQRVVVIAEQSERDIVSVLEQQGAVVWQPAPEELLEGAGDEEPRSGYGRELIRSARVSSSLSVRPIQVHSREFDKVADALRQAERGINESAEDARQAIGEAFGILFDIADWYAPAGDALVTHVRQKLDRAASQLIATAHFLPADVNRAVNDAFEGLAAIVDSLRTASSPKMSVMAELLDRRDSEGQRTLVVTRTPEAAERLQSLIHNRWHLAQAIPYRAIPVHSTYASLILTGWPGSRSVGQVLGRFTSPDVQLIGYGFESRWLAARVRRDEIMSRRWSLDGTQRSTLLGIPARDSAKPAISIQPELSHEPEDLLESMRIERMHRTGRKGAAAGGPADHNAEARYVGFVGATYAYLTESHGTTRIDALLRGEVRAGTGVEQVKPAELRSGDHVLFRATGRAGVIAQLAEHLYGKDYLEAKKIAASWRTALRRIGPSAGIVYRALRAAGLSQQYATVRGWIEDEATIGPQNESDVRLIAKVAEDEWLLANTEEVCHDITFVRGCHVAAGPRLTALLLTELPRHIASVNERETRVSLSFGDVWVVQIEDIAVAVERRGYTEINRLMWDDRYA